MSQYISYPIQTHPGDLPDLTDAELLAQGFISGFRVKLQDDAVAAAHLAAAQITEAQAREGARRAANYRALGWKCHASTPEEIAAQT